MPSIRLYYKHTLLPCNNLPIDTLPKSRGLIMDATGFAKAYFNFCGDIGERPEHVVVSAGGALLMLGLRDDTDDLDLDVRHIVYAALASRLGHSKQRRSSHGTYMDYSDSISLHVMPSHIRPQCVNGVYLYSVNDLIIQKEKLARAPDRKPEKMAQDLKDIEALKQLQLQR